MIVLGVRATKSEREPELVRGVEQGELAVDALADLDYQLLDLGLYCLEQSQCSWEQTMIL